jgi:hypothetical protein
MFEIMLSESGEISLFLSLFVIDTIITSLRKREENEKVFKNLVSLNVPLELI